MAEQSKARISGRIRNMAENIIISMAGAEASRRSTEGAVTGAVGGAEQKKVGFFQWVKQTFPTLTRDDDRGVARLLDTRLEEAERESIAALRAALKGKVTIDGEEKYYDEEQWIMDMWLDSNEFEQKLAAQNQQGADQARVVAGRAHIQGLAMLLARQFQPHQAAGVSAFFRQYAVDNQDAGLLQADLWQMYEANRRMMEANNPAIVIIGAIADNQGNYQAQRQVVEDYGLLVPKQAAAGEMNPAVKLFKELAALPTIEDQVKRLLSSGRLVEMKLGKRIVRSLSRETVATVTTAVFGAGSIVLALVLFIYYTF